jgi:hypothetical protein
MDINNGIAGTLYPASSIVLNDFTITDKELIKVKEVLLHLHKILLEENVDDI